MALTSLTNSDAISTSLTALARAFSIPTGSIATLTAGADLDSKVVLYDAANELTLVLWDTLTGPYTVISYAANAFGGFDVVTSQGTKEFVTPEVYRLRKGGDGRYAIQSKVTDIRGWGVDTSIQVSDVDTDNDKIPDYVSQLTDVSLNIIKAKEYCDVVEVRSKCALMVGAAQIPLLEKQMLRGGGREITTLVVTANAGQRSKALSPFLTYSYSSVTGFEVVYPEQALDETDIATIKEYPPFIALADDAVTSCRGVQIKDFRLKNVYDFIDQSNALGYGQLEVAEIYGNVGYRLLSSSGHMGNTSHGNDISVTLAFGNWGSNVEKWCRDNTLGLNFYPAGGNTRIDGFMFTNLSLIGGKSSIAATAGTWLQITNYQFDICKQVITGACSEIYLAGAGFISAQDGTYSEKHKPVVELSAGNLHIGGVSRIGTQIPGSNCAIYAPFSKLVLNGVSFESSLGYFTPVIVCNEVNASGCKVQTSIENRKLAFSDVTRVNTDNVVIDGIDSWDIDTAVDLNGIVTNINMGAWTNPATAPDSWTSSIVGDVSQYAIQIPGGGIFINPPASTSSFWFKRDLSAVYEYFGHFAITARVTISSQGGGNAVDGTCDIYIGNDTDGWNKSNNVLGNGNVNAEASGLPLDTPLYVMFYLPVPLLKTGVLELRVQCNYLTAANHVGIAIDNIQLRKMKAGTGDRSNQLEARGNEFLYNQAGSIRDVLQPTGKYLLTRLHAPTAGGLYVVGDKWQQAVPAVGAVIGGACQTQGVPGAWVSEGVYS